MTNAVKKATRKITTWLSRREAIRLNRVGGETPDPTPVHIPGNCEKPLSLRDEMRRFITSELTLQAEAHGAETFEESNDFEIDDEQQDLTSAYTVLDMAPEGDLPKDDLEGTPDEKTAEATSQEAEQQSPPTGEPDGGAVAKPAAPSPQSPVQ